MPTQRVACGWPIQGTGLAALAIDTARRAPTGSSYLADVAAAVFDAVGDRASVQVVAGPITRHIAEFIAEVRAA